MNDWKRREKGGRRENPLSFPSFICFPSSLAWMMASVAKRRSFLHFLFFPLLFEHKKGNEIIRKKVDEPLFREEGSQDGPQPPKVLSLMSALPQCQSSGVLPLSPPSFGGRGTGHPPSPPPPSPNDFSSGAQGAIVTGDESGEEEVKPGRQRQRRRINIQLILSCNLGEGTGGRIGPAQNAST